MIQASILTPRGTTFDIDLLTGDDPDVIGAARIVGGNIGGAVKAIIVGQEAQERLAGRTIGPMYNGSTLTVAGPADNAVLVAEIESLLGVKTPDCFKPVVPLHDRYESPSQYAMSAN